ncbi:hypothetical protein M3Y99_00642500 [Aphelenchoides fujianensis]|nr:hypothetical protein M3Y99_00642500 [Aphelenchoides fujianensis]
MGFSTLGLSTTAPTCLCNMGVRQGTYVIGFVYLVGHVLNVLAGMHELMAASAGTRKSNRPEDLQTAVSGPTTTLFSVIIAVVCSFLTALMLYGNRIQKRSLIRPFLVVELVLCWFIFAAAALLLLGGVVSVLVPSSDYGTLSSAWMLMAAVSSAVGLVRLCGYVVVKRAYNQLTPFGHVA